jgi:hypothetical protein
MERLWRKRAEYDAKLGKSRAGLPIEVPSKPAAAPAESPPIPPQLPKEDAEVQSGLSLRQEEERRRVSSPQSAPSRPSSGSAALAKRMATAVSSSARAAPSPRVPSQGQDAASGIHNSSSITKAAFKYSDNSTSGDGAASGISLMGPQLESTVRRLNQSAVLQRSRAKGMSEIKAENTMLLIQAVARNDSNTVNSMLQQGQGSIDDTDDCGNSAPPTPPPPPTPSPH